ncbi:MAG TPA: hypothetical protein VMV09_10265 [Candidatus Saccharimonadales bacterium]|nr:hypothetical protein [Candidatus Saccharimonadales bacterium]
MAKHVVAAVDVRVTGTMSAAAVSGTVVAWVVDPDNAGSPTYAIVVSDTGEVLPSYRLTNTAYHYVGRRYPAEGQGE